MWGSATACRHSRRPPARARHKPPPRGGVGRGDAACGAAFADLFAPTELLLPRAPAGCVTSIGVGADDALGEYARRRRAHVACWELREHTNWYVQGQPSEADKEAARRRQAEWLARLRPAAAVAQAVDALRGRIGGRPAVSLHVRRGDHRLPCLASPLWILFAELDRQLERTAAAAAAAGARTGAAASVEPLVLLATDAPDVEARVVARYGAERVIAHAKARVAADERAARDAMEEALVDMLLLSLGDVVVGSFASSFSEVAAMFGGGRPRRRRPAARRSGRRTHAGRRGLRKAFAGRPGGGCGRGDGGAARPDGLGPRQGGGEAPAALRCERGARNVTPKP